MHDSIGWLREKLGRTVNKAMLLRNVGEFYEKRPIYEWRDTVTKSGQLTKKPFVVGETVEKVVKWRVVAQQFFGHKELYWMPFKKGMAYELKLENEAYGRGETHVQFIDYETGDSLNFSGRVTANKDPITLAKAIDVSTVKTFAHSLRGIGANLAICAVVALAFLFVGWTIGNNWGDIVATFQGIGAPHAPIQTPTVIIGGG